MSKKFTKEDFIKKSNKTHNIKYDYSNVEYVDSRSYVEINCLIHGIFKQNASSHLRGSNCPDCARDINLKKRKKNNKKTQKKRTVLDVIELFNKIHQNKYNYEDFVEYKNIHQNINIKCPIHGNFNQTIRDHERGSECKICAKEKGASKRSLDINLFKKRANNIYNFKYDYSYVVYSNLNEKIKIICPIHGIFEQKAHHHLAGHSCPTCVNLSNGEKQLRKILKEKNIKYITQKRFKDCKNIKTLPFDFYLPLYNVCIEYNGGQHYEIVEVFGGKDGFIKIQKNDKIKIEYCLKNDIKLIVVALSKYISKEMFDYYKNKNVKLIMVDKIKKK